MAKPVQKSIDAEMANLDKAKALLESSAASARREPACQGGR
jgi:hypothetical protein